MMSLMDEETEAQKTNNMSNVIHRIIWFQS